MESRTTKINIYCIAGITLMVTLAICSLFVGKYPLSLSSLIAGDKMQWNIFKTLRLGRVLMGVVGGFALGISGFIFQTIFRNPLASPDIIGVSSGASAGAAFGILFLGGSFAINTSSFIGAILAVICSILLSSMDKSHNKSTIVLAGISVHAISQTTLMCLKMAADPEKELASIEFWIMGSLNGVKFSQLPISCIIILGSALVLFLLYRQAVLLAQNEDEAKMLGVSVGAIRLIILFFATLMVAATVCLTGLISFVGLIVPHIAKLLTRHTCIKTMFLSGILGSVLLIIADMLARSIAQTELPVSIFTSILGAPFLIFLVLKKRRR